MPFLCSSSFCLVVGGYPVCWCLVSVFVKRRNLPLVHGLPQPGWRITAQYFLKTLHGLLQTDLRVGLHGMNLQGHQLCRGRAADLHGIDNGTVGKKLRPGSDAILLVSSMLAYTDSFQVA